MQAACAGRLQLHRPTHRSRLIAIPLLPDPTGIAGVADGDPNRSHAPKAAAELFKLKPFALRRASVDTLARSLHSESYSGQYPPSQKFKSLPLFEISVLQSTILRRFYRRSSSGVRISPQRAGRSGWHGQNRYTVAYAADIGAGLHQMQSLHERSPKQGRIFMEGAKFPATGTSGTSAYLSSPRPPASKAKLLRSVRGPHSD